MAVISAAVLAVGAAIATTTFATVATAVVTVSIAVGTIGLAVTAVGAITGNKDLLKAGEIMGYVGLAGGLAGGVIGGIGGLSAGTGFFQGAAGAYTGAGEMLSKGWNQGVGSLFNSGTGAQVAGPAGSGTFTQAPGAQPGVGQFPSTSVAPNAAPAFGGPQGQGYLMTAEGAAAPASPAAGIMNAPLVATPMAPALPIAPAAPTVGVSPAAQSAGNIFSEMPDWMKYSAMTAGLQGLSGAAAGWFQGASAEERLEFEKLVNSQRQGQVELTNQRGAYAPTLNFAPRPGPAGTLNS